MQRATGQTSRAGITDRLDEVMALCWRGRSFPGEADQPAPPDAPFTYHCHILEHEDGGMMGQFEVS